MQSITHHTFDPARTINRLHLRLSFDLKARFREDARECAVIARFLARELGSASAKALATRAKATARLLEVSCHV